MSVSIKYDDYAEFPSFPYVDLEVSNVYVEKYFPQKGKVDTGSYITIIPEYMLELLDLHTVSRTESRTSNTEEYQEDVTYFVKIKIGSVIFPYIEVISRPDKIRPNVLLGRNLLNLWKMQLDGQTHSGLFQTWSMNPRDAT
jgi:hypothetical protein